jgi:hypothetical protein
MLPTIGPRHISDPWRQIKDPPLWQSSGDKGIDVTVGVSDGFQTTGYAEAIEEFCNSLIEVCSNLVIWDARNRGVRRKGAVEHRECLTVAVS